MKRPNGAGNIEPLDSGHFRVRMVVDGQRITIGTYQTEAEADRMAAAWVCEREDGNITAASAVTVASLGESMLARRELHGSRSRMVVRDIETEKCLWNRHVLPSDLASMAVQSVRPRDGEDYLLWLRKREAVHAIQTKAGTVLRPQGRAISAKSQKNIRRLLVHCFDEAIRRDLIDTNPMTHAHVAPGVAADLEDDWLRESEIDSVLQCEDLSLRDRTAYACGIGLALRLNDLKRIPLSDVHLDAEVPGPHVRVWVAKVERWHRVPVMPWLEPWLQAHIRTLPKGAVWLFPKTNGEQYRKSYQFNWSKKPQRRGGALRVTPSALRRAGVNREIRLGISPIVNARFGPL